MSRFSNLRNTDQESRFRRIEEWLSDLGDIPSQLAEMTSNSQVDPTGGGVSALVLSGGASQPASSDVTLAGDVIGSNQQTTVVQIEAVPIPAPAVGDDQKFIRYKNATPTFEYANVQMAGDVTGDNTAVVIAKLARPLFDHYTDAGNTAGETDLYSDTLAAGRLANNGEKILAQYGGTFAGSATSTQRLRAYFGGTLIFDSGALSIGAATDSWDLKVTVIRESASAVRCSLTLTTNFATLSSYATYTRVTGLTLANTQVVKITGEAAGVGAAANQIVASEGFVEFRAAA